MSDAKPKEIVFRELGYGGCFDELDRALEEVGLSRTTKMNISGKKAGAVRRALLDRFIMLCSRGDCQIEGAETADGRQPVPASSQEDCAVCGGSANARAVDQLISDLHHAGMSKVCVVGGSPNARTELERLVAGRVELRLIDGITSRASQQARGDVAWADRVVIWGATILAHKVSKLYRGEHVIQMARRSIQELAREVGRSIS